MSYLLPPVDSPLRSMFTIDRLVDIGTGRVMPPTFREALHTARDYMASQPWVHSMQYITLRADGSLTLTRFGRRGGAKTLWKFGTYSRAG